MSWETGGGELLWPPADRVDGARMGARVLAEGRVKTKSRKGDGEGNKWLCKCCLTPRSSFCNSVCSEHSKPGSPERHPHPSDLIGVLSNDSSARLALFFACVLRSVLPLKPRICHILAAHPHSLMSLLCWLQKKPGRTVIRSQASQQNWWLM